MVNDLGGRDGLSKKRLKWEEQRNKVFNSVPIDLASAFTPPANISTAERKEAHEEIRQRLSCPIGGAERYFRMFIRVGGTESNTS